MTGNTKTREYSWRDFIVRSDPNFVRNSRYVTEYEFSAKGTGDERTHDGARRVFRAYYDKRGIYAPPTVLPGGLTWGGIPINWGEQPLEWEDE